MNNKEALRDITNSKDSRAAMRIGQSIRTSQAWTECKKNVMTEILRAKAQHCSIYKNTLLKIPNNTSIHEDTSHPYWGARNGGADNLGQLHMVIKNELQNSTISNKPGSLTPAPNAPNNRHPKVQQKPRVSILGDSNTRYLDPSRMIRSHSFKIQPTATAEQAVQDVKLLQNQDIVVLHVGTNDLNRKSAKETATLIMKAAHTAHERGSKVVISQLLPREGALLHKVKETNQILMHTLKGNPDIRFTDTTGFSHHQRPDRNLFRQQFRDNQPLPLLHLNQRGVAMLSHQISSAVRALPV